MMNNANIRSVLKYVPDFQDKLFVIHIEHGLELADEMVDTLLDLVALHNIGVKIVLVTANSDASKLYAQTRVCEMRSALVEAPLSSGRLVIKRIEEILHRRQLPIVASGIPDLTFDDGTISMATVLKAHKFIALMDAQKVPTKDGNPIHAIPESDVASITGNISNKDLLLAAAEVCRRGIQRVHLLNGRSRGVLVDELFSEEGVGTMVHTDSYREIRSLREEDIPELLSMIARSIMSDQLIERSYEDIHDHLEDYYVFTLDESIIGCVAVYPYPEQQSAELGCLYIKQSHEGRGYGRALCAFAEQKARQLGMKFIFALSQSAVYYFRDRLHYAEYSRNTLPPQRRIALECSGRHSGVFGRPL